MPAREFSLENLLKQFPCDGLETSPEFLKFCSEYIKNLPEEFRPSRGDVISLNDVSDQNEDILFWTGEHLVGVDYIFNEHGHLPLGVFHAGEEFPFDHWQKVMKNDVYFTTVRSEFLNRMVITDMKIYVYEDLMEIVQLFFTVNGRTGVCYIDKKRLRNVPEMDRSLNISDFPELEKIFDKGLYQCFCNPCALDSFEMGKKLFDAEVHVICY